MNGGYFKELKYKTCYFTLLNKMSIGRHLLSSHRECLLISWYFLSSDC